MTYVDVKRTLTGGRLSVTGHADRTEDAARGNIVCAALSILAQTLAEYIMQAEDEQRADIIELTLKSGEAVIEFISEDEEVNGAFSAAVTGFSLLSDRYPELVVLSEESEVQCMADLCQFGDIIITDSQDGFNRRLKKLNDERLRRADGFINKLSARYGTPRGDIDALDKAIDESFGKMSGASLEELIDLWRGQESSVKELYPDFDLKSGLSDRKFFSLLYRGIDVRTAYEIMHRDELLRSAMEYAAKTVKQLLLADMPFEGSVREGALDEAAAVKESAAPLTQKQRKELIRRAERGEKIRL